jgi:hypothetical protein
VRLLRKQCAIEAVSKAGGVGVLVKEWRAEKDEVVPIAKVSGSLDLIVMAGGPDD